MKRLFAFAAAALALFLLLPSPRVLVSAEEDARYAVAETDGVWFYASENGESGLFQIPATYYVRVLKEGAFFTAVQYLDDVAPYRAVTGYCRTEDLTFVDFVPQRPYLRKEITVTYNVAGDALMGNGVFDKLEKQFVYYGTSYSGTARFFYVLSDGVFGYVPATQEIVFERNTDFLTPSSSEQPPAEAPSSSPSATQVIVICAVGLALFAAAVLLLRGKRSLPAAEEF